MRGSRVAGAMISYQHFAPCKEEISTLTGLLSKVNEMITSNRVFSRDVTAAILVSLNIGTAAMLVSPTNPLGIELYSYANVFFCFG